MAASGAGREPAGAPPPALAAAGSAPAGAIPRLCGPPQLPFGARHSLKFEQCSLQAVWLILVSLSLGHGSTPPHVPVGLAVL